VTFKILCKINLVCNSFTGKSQNFEKVRSTDNLIGEYLGNASFGDYNKGGYLNIFISRLNLGPNDNFINTILRKYNGDKTFK
jgi:hypothetical protein